MTRVALLWHMHQPWYGDPLTGEQVLPWTRLHALKDYFGMVEMIREFPEIRLTFNLVPSLLVQLDDLANERVGDRYLELGLKPAAALAPEERAFLVANSFHVSRARMVEPHPRYAELLAKRESAATETTQDLWSVAAARFDERDLRDLQVWQKLVWIDPLYLERDKRVRELVHRGQDFTEEDKVRLHEVEREILRRVIPEYRDAAARGQVELSTSPFYHPILPLLCDTDIYPRGPHDAERRLPFRHPEDAAEQLARGVDCHVRFFADVPKGFWPPEGSVSEAVVRLGAEANLGWMATDEVILARSRRTGFTRDASGHLEQPELLYRPYRVVIGSDHVACLFRDHVLSDLIGFSYAGWRSQDAAEDLLNRIVEAGRRYSARTGGGEATIGIALDGENAWEHYEGGGRPFLRTLYHLLSTHPELRTVTMTEATEGATEVLDTLVPGSWANGDFYIWIGHQDDRRAWGQLADARRTLESARGRVDAAAWQAAREELLIAEGSDWFWWYGDDHSSEQDMEFDALFRGHVQSVYARLGFPVPEELQFSNITVGPKTIEVVQPTSLIQPKLDGRAGQEDGWDAAGYPVLKQYWGTMRQAAEATEARVKAIRFGFDRTHFFVRVDLNAKATDVIGGNMALRIAFSAPSGLRVTITGRDGRITGRLWRRVNGDGAWEPEASHLRLGADEVIETAIPLGDLGVGPGDRVAFFVRVNRGDVEVAHYPSQVPVTTVVP